MTKKKIIIDFFLIFNEFSKNLNIFNLCYMSIKENPLNFTHKRPFTLIISPLDIISYY